MAGLGPATHDFRVAQAKSWMPGPSPGRTAERFESWIEAHSTNSDTGLKVVTSTRPMSEIRSSGITTSASSECCM